MDEEKTRYITIDVGAKLTADNHGQVQALADAYGWEYHEALNYIVTNGLALLRSTRGLLAEVDEEKVWHHITYTPAPTMSDLHLVRAVCLCGWRSPQAAREAAETLGLDHLGLLVTKIEHTYTIEPAPKMDALDLVRAACTCGYRSAGTTEREARMRARMHLKAVTDKEKEK